MLLSPKSFVTYLLDEGRTVTLTSVQIYMSKDR